MKIKVLLVEDNEMILKGLTYMLETEGFEVMTAKNYREAQGKIFGVDGNADFDIAVLDVTLPDGDGFRLCTEIKEDIGTPVIFLTAKDEEKDVVHGFEFTALEYKILLLLFRNAGRTVTREMILSKIWDVAGNYVNDNTLTVYIKRIRTRLGDADVIKTVKGMGYRVEG